MEFIFGFLFIWLLFSCGIAALIVSAGKHKDIDTTVVFLVSILLSPIVAMFLVLVAKDKKEEK